MINATLIKFALFAIKANARYSVEGELGALSALMRPPYFDTVVRYPIEEATGHDDRCLPSKEHSEWLQNERDKGHLGPWDCCVGRDDLGYHLLVSFLNEEDAVLFKMKCG